MKIEHFCRGFPCATVYFNFPILISNWVHAGDSFSFCLTKQTITRPPPGWTFAHSLSLSPVQALPAAGVWAEEVTTATTVSVKARAMVRIIVLLQDLLQVSRQQRN
jgi:hypothetical protein